MGFIRVTLKKSDEMEAGEIEEFLSLFSHTSIFIILHIPEVTSGIYSYGVRGSLKRQSPLLSLIGYELQIKYQTAYWHHQLVEKKYFFSSI